MTLKVTFLGIVVSNSSFTLWGNNQPDNSGAGATDADYAVMFNGGPGAWGDYGDTYNRPYLLEIYTTTALIQTEGLPSGSLFPVGTTTNTFTVTDAAGNTSTCSFDVTVEDNIDPMIFCPADIVAGTSGGNCGTVVTFATPVGMDNCGIDQVIQQAGIASGEIFPVGVTTNQFAVIDVNGNVAFCSFTVTVTDDDAPIAVCQDITVMLDGAGMATIVPADVDGGSTDNCGITSLSIDIDTFTCADLGDNIVTLTATDGQGLSSSCTAIVTVENGVMPNAVCQDATVQLDAFGMVTITDASIFDGGSTDACGGTKPYL